MYYSTTCIIIVYNSDECTFLGLCVSLCDEQFCKLYVLQFLMKFLILNMEQYNINTMPYFVDLSHPATFNHCITVTSANFSQNYLSL